MINTVTEQEMILEYFIRHTKTLTRYYPYPTGGYGTENVIAEATMDSNPYLSTIISLMVSLGAKCAGSNVDNKTAVEVFVEGLDDRLYCYMYDNRYFITKKIHQQNGHEGIRIRQIIY